MMIKNKFDITITHAAQSKIKKLVEENSNLKFRIYIIGGGCNGFQYKFKLDHKVNYNDIVIKKKIIIVIDSISFQYINGGKLDYQQNLEGSKFIISNPNAQTTCSCGISFSI